MEYFILLSETVAESSGEKECEASTVMVKDSCCWMKQAWKTGKIILECCAGSTAKLKTKSFR